MNGSATDTYTDNNASGTARFGISLLIFFFFFSLLTFAGTGYAREESSFTNVLDRSILEVCLSQDGLGFAVVREGLTQSTNLYRTKDYGKTWERLKPFKVARDGNAFEELNENFFLIGLTIKTSGYVYVTGYNTSMERYPTIKYSNKRKIFGSSNQGDTWWIDDEYDGDSDYLYINERFRRTRSTKSLNDNLYVSGDSGTTWKSTNIYFVSRLLDNNVWIDSRLAVNGKTMAVTNPNIAGSISISIDGGLSWKKTEIPNKSSVFGMDIASNGYIFVANEDGEILLSKNNGQTWETFDRIAEVYDISVCENRGTIIMLAATKRGLKRAEYKTSSLLTDTTSKEGDKTVITSVVDKYRLEEKLAAEGNNSVLSITFDSLADAAAVELSGQMIRNMEEKQALVELKANFASYRLPAQFINIDDIARQLGSGVILEDIKVRISISKSPAETVKIMESKSKSGQFKIVAPPIDFSVTCTYKDRTVQVKKLKNYVERTITVPDGVALTKLSTGVILNSNGTVAPVPSKKALINGKNRVIVNSPDNGDFSIIYYPMAFKDAEKHWARYYINELGSRLITLGDNKNNFTPDREITKAEFMVIVLKALGLLEETGVNKAASKDWFYGYSLAAYKNGIINSYMDGTFMPDKAITREEAMEIIARAIKSTGIATEISDSAANAQLAMFKDIEHFSGMESRKYAAVCVKYGIVVGSNGMLKPKNKISRAETAVMVIKMLERVNYI